MKNRLLEDFGDSQSAVPVRPVRWVQAAPAPQPQAEVAPSHAPEPEAPAHQRAGVWRSRSAAASPAPPVSPRAEQAAQAFVPPRVEPSIEPSFAAEPLRAAPHISPEIASFSSSEPDWSIPLQPEPPPWTERWGRKALGWTIGLAAFVAVAGTAAWMVQETRVESTLAVVADHTPAQAASPAAPTVAPAAPATESGTETLPPLKMLPAEPVATAPVAAAPENAGEETAAPAEVAPAAIGAAAAVAAGAKLAASPPVKKPAARQVQERRLAAATPAKRIRPETKKQPAKPAREPVVARPPVAPARAVSAEQPDPESPLAETLRLCRAAGYHATACLKRGCEATRFGLVCRG